MTTLSPEKLSTLSLKQLQNIDIRNGEDEKLVQEAINSKVAVLPPSIKFNRLLVPDIKNGEQEKEWQAKIDAFEKEQAPIEVQIIKAENELKEVTEAIVTETAEVKEVTETPKVKKAKK